MGTLRFNSIQDIDFWYTNHEYEACTWHDKLVAEAVALNLTIPSSNPRRDPCGDGGGVYLLGDQERCGIFLTLIVRQQSQIRRCGEPDSNKVSSPLASPIRSTSNANGSNFRVGFYGVDIHNSGDDGIFGQDETMFLKVRESTTSTSSLPGTTRFD